jgi:hypothetical protein
MNTRWSGRERQPGLADGHKEGAMKHHTTPDRPREQSTTEYRPEFPPRKTVPP